MDEVFLQGLLANITPADLTNYARRVPQRADFYLTQSVFPYRNIANVKWRTRNSRLRVAAARFRAYDAPTPWLRADAGRSIREGYLPPLGAKEAIEEFQIILDEIARGADDERLLDALFNNVDNQVEAIHSRLELAAGDLLTDGIIEIDENGVIQEADFGVRATHKPTAAVWWDDPAAKILDDERAWIRTMTANGGARPARALTSESVIAAYATNTQYRDVFWGGTVTGVTRPNLTPDQVNQVRATYGLPTLIPYEVTVPVADEAGQITEVRVLPENLFILLPSDSRTDLGETLFGRTAESVVLSTGSNPQIVRQDAPGLISVAETSFDPVSVTTKTGAIAMPVLHTPDSIVIATVLEG